MSPDGGADVIGFLRMNACRKYLYPINERWNAIVLMQKVNIKFDKVECLDPVINDIIVNFQIVIALNVSRWHCDMLYF